MQEASASAGLPIQRLFNPCNACKARHQKCDNRRPSCSSCRRGGIECVRAHSVRFRHTLNPSVRSGRGSEFAKRDYTFAHNQPWVEVGRSLSFVDETQEIASINDSGTGNQGTVGDVEDNTAVSSPYSRRRLSSPRSFTAVDTSLSPTAPSQASELASSSPDNTPTTEAEDRSVVVGQHGVGRALSLDSTSGAALSSPGTDVSSLPEQPPNLIFSPESIDTANPFAPLLDQAHLGQDVLLGLPCEDSFVELQIDGLATSPRRAAVRSGSSIYLDTPQWPLRDYQQAFLLRYYVENVAPLLDLCDQDRRHFATVVPQRAAACPLLLYAMLAASAKRLSRIGGFDGLVVDRYHQDCLRLLIPALSSSAAIVDENLLTAIVLLRYTEELDVPVAPPGPEFHLMGTRVFLAAQEETSDFSGLRLAAFWVALRQEIYMAFVHSRPVHANFVLKDIGKLIQPDDNGSGFANGIIIHCANCLRYCYGSEEWSVSAWKELREYQERWWRDRPWFFQPVWASEPESNSIFQTEMYLSDAVVTGLQHYHLARILLMAHNPEIPKLGPGQVTAFRKTNDEIKNAVRVICGIAESNPRTAPAYVNACIAITMAGDRFTERHEQEALCGILEKTDRQMGWPTRSAQSGLREAWGWEESHSGMSIADILNGRSQTSSQVQS